MQFQLKVYFCVCQNVVGSNTSILFYEIFVTERTSQ